MSPRPRAKWARRRARTRARAKQPTRRFMVSTPRAQRLMPRTQPPAARWIKLLERHEPCAQSLTSCGDVRRDREVDDRLCVCRDCVARAVAVELDHGLKDFIEPFFRPETYQLVYLCGVGNAARHVFEPLLVRFVVRHKDDFGIRIGEFFHAFGEIEN